MTEPKIDTSELQKFGKKNFWLTLISLASLFSLALIFSLIFKEDLQYLAEWIWQKFGFNYVALIVLVNEIILGLIPPDLILFLITKSSLKADWFYYVSIIGLASYVGGNFGWVIGRLLIRMDFLSKKLLPIIERNRPMVKKFGALAVMISALTPIPFSLICMLAGFMGMKWRRFALAALWRIPRMYIYYLVLSASNF